MALSRSVCLGVLLIAAACSSDDAQRSGTRAPVAAIGASASSSQGRGGGQATARLTSDMARPYFDSGPAAGAAERFALEDWGPARDGFAAYLASDPGEALSRADRARVGLLMAVCDTHLGEWSRAAQGFARAAEVLPDIADYIHYQAARAYYFAHDLDRAMRHARQVAAGSIVGADAELLIGDILRAREDWPRMAAHYATYLQKRSDGIRLSEARYRLAQARERAGAPSGELAEAIELYRRVTISAPLTSWATKARARLDDLYTTLGEAERARYQTLTADELIERGMSYYRAMRNPLSEADFEAALSAPGLTIKSRCVAAYHRANSVYKARDRKRAAPLFDRAIAACERAGNDDLHVKAAYQAGRSYAFIGERDTAIERYGRAETISATHTYRDDARLRQAEEHAELGNDDKVSELLASIPELYPDGDMRAEAVWRLAWRAYRDGDFEQAVKWLKKQIQVKPIDHNYWAEGQAQYWLGRAYAKLGKTDDSIAAYRQAVMRYPLSYYAMLALNRLREGHRAAFDKVRAEIRAAPASYQPGEPAFRFAPRAEYASPGFARAMEFLRLGLGQPAEAELKRVGMNIPPGKKPLSDPDRIERVWATAFLYDRAGRYAQSHWPTRWHILDYKRKWPVGKNRARWHIAYPRGFWSLVDKHAKQHGFPPEILMAIMREESAFNPLLESYANAVGLTQMIFPTARRFARGTGIEVTRANLRDPEKNVTIGSRFLSFLWDKWDKQIMLVPPSYNAGENAVARMLRARGHLAADEWLESIKTDQARRYSKRVLASYFVYSYLYRDTIPTISNEIPEGLIPGKK